jgi:hypothetical protein
MSIFVIHKILLFDLLIEDKQLRGQAEKHKEKHKEKRN